MTINQTIILILEICLCVCVFSYFVLIIYSYFLLLSSWQSYLKAKYFSGDSI